MNFLASKVPLSPLSEAIPFNTPWVFFIEGNNVDFVKFPAPIIPMTAFLLTKLKLLNSILSLSKISPLYSRIEAIEKF